jgi:hypothetical protein
MKKVQIYVLGIVSIYLSSCAPAYVPNVINTPMLSNKGEFQASVHSGTSGVDPQFAYAVTDNIGIMLNGSFMNRVDTAEDYGDFHKHQFYEVGIGYYKKIGQFGRFETFGGYGFGKIKTNFDSNLWEWSSDVRTNRYFIQPAIGFSNSFFDGSFASRIVVVDLKQDSYRNTAMFLEPVITAKLGYKYVKWMVQMGFSVPITPNGKINFEYEPFIFSGGIQIDLGRKFDKPDSDN